MVGEPEPRQRACYDALLAGVCAEFELARPGATAEAVLDAAVAEVERSGGPSPYRRGMMVEDTGVVTGEGFELFTSIDRSLRVVPA